LRFDCFLSRAIRAPDRLAVMRPFGTRLPFESAKAGAAVTVGSRRYLRLAGISDDEAIRILRAAK